MKIVALLLSSALACAAQSVTVTYGSGSKFDIVLRPRTQVVATTCEACPSGGCDLAVEAAKGAGAVELEPGESMKCSAWLNQAARIGGAHLAVVYPVGLGGPVLVTVPFARASVTWTVQRPDTLAGMGIRRGRLPWTRGALAGRVLTSFPSRWEAK